MFPELTHLIDQKVNIFFQGFKINLTVWNKGWVKLWLGDDCLSKWVTSLNENNINSQLKSEIKTEAPSIIMELY